MFVIIKITLCIALYANSNTTSSEYKVKFLTRSNFNSFKIYVSEYAEFWITFGFKGKGKYFPQIKTKILHSHVTNIKEDIIRFN